MELRLRMGSEVSLANFRKDIYLELYNEAGVVMGYKILSCWVSEYQAMPDLDANANAIQSNISSWKTRAGNATPAQPRSRAHAE